MKYNDIEKELSHFKIKEPNQNLRDKILLKARTVWTEKHRVPVFTFRLIRNYAYGLAMLLLISIVSSKIDSFLTDRVVDGRTVSVTKNVEKNRDLETLCSDFEIDCKTYQLFANMVKIEENNTKPTVFDQLEQLKKEFNLTNGGLS